MNRHMTHYFDQHYIC